LFYFENSQLLTRNCQFDPSFARFSVKADTTSTSRQPSCRIAEMMTVTYVLCDRKRKIASSSRFSSASCGSPSFLTSWFGWRTRLVTSLPALHFWKQQTN